MKRYNKNLGDFGEKAAVDNLKEKGYEIISEKYLVKGGEVDIIAYKDNTLVFIEVKTRSTDAFGSPAEAVDNRKIKRLKFAAEAFYRENPYDAEIRFDVFEVYAEYIDKKPYLKEINHIENIIVD